MSDTSTPASQSDLFPEYEFPELKKLYGTPAPEAAPTPERIDHAVEATRTVDQTLSYGEYGEDAGAVISMIAAQVHATLALVEQQRTANLIAYVAKWMDDEVLDVDALIRERLGLL